MTVLPSVSTSRAMRVAGREGGGKHHTSHLVGELRKFKGLRSASTIPIGWVEMPRGPVTSASKSAIFNECRMFTPHATFRTRLSGDHGIATGEPVHLRPADLVHGQAALAQLERCTFVLGCQEPLRELPRKHDREWHGRRSNNLMKIEHDQTLIRLIQAALVKWGTLM